MNIFNLSHNPVLRRPNESTMHSNHIRPDRACGWPIRKTPDIAMAKSGVHDGSGKWGGRALIGR